VRTSNSQVEIIGSDADQVTVSASSHATVTNLEGRTQVTAESDKGGTLTVQVPRRSSLHVVTSNGGIRVSGLAGPLRLDTSNGGIVVQAASESEIHAHTSNGAIEIAVAPGLNANISARTSNSRIYSDLDVVTNHVSATELEGTIGKGGPPIDLHTSNGSIYLKLGGNRESVTSMFQSGPVK
jgi:DUF4097 and DUF4098 domain-containing protein YvlB